MRLLLWLYPRSWRSRYRLEMEALLQRTRPTPGVAWDLVRGGLDARLHPQCTRTRRRRLSRIGLPALAFVLGSCGFAMASIVWLSRSKLVTVGAAISLALGITLATWGLRRRRRGAHDPDDDHDARAGVPARPRPGGAGCD